MRVVFRILGFVAVSGGAAVVTAIGCGVDKPQYPGLANEVPNTLGGAGSVVGGGNGGSSTSTTTTTTTTTGAGGNGGAGGGTVTSDAGPAESLCDVAEALLVGGGPCSVCELAATCATFRTNCSTCSTGTMCVDSCTGDPTCIGNCLTDNVPFETFIQCVFTDCGSSCGLSPPLACPLPDAGI